MLEQHHQNPLPLSVTVLFQGSYPAANPFPTANPHFRHYASRSFIDILS